MIRLFRKIRQKLLIDGKFGKYLLYAIGEIIILIFGILFALQVNNWNEDRKEKIIEISVLKTFKAELEKDNSLWQDDIDLHTDAMVSMQNIIDHIEKDLPYTDSLSYHFINASVNSKFAYNQGALVTLKSTGVIIITNEKLRNEIVELYTNWFDYMMYLTRHMDKWQNFGSEFIWSTRFDQAEYFDDYLTQKEWDGAMIPLDFEGLKIDDEYKYFLRTYKNSTKYYLDELINTRSRVDQIVLDIEKEIEELEK